MMNSTQHIQNTKKKNIDGPSSNYWIIIISALSAFFISSMDVGGVIPEITPFIVKEFHPNAGLITLLGSISTMAMVSIMIASGCLGNKFGPRKILMAGAFLAIVSDIGAFLFSSNVEILIFFRGLVGLGAGLSSPMIPAVIMLSSPIEEHPKAFGIFMAATSITGAIRSPIIQLINTRFGWRAVFLLVAILNGICLLLICLNIPKQKKKINASIDLTGILLSGFGFFGIIVGTSFSSSLGFSHPVSFCPLVLGVFILLLLINYSKKKLNPAVQISLFKNKIFAFSMLFGHFLYSAEGIIYFITIYGLTAGGINPLKMSTYGLTLAISEMFAGLIAGQIAKRISKNLIISLSGILISIGLILLSTQFKTDMDWTILYLSAFCIGFGFSSANSRRMSIALKSVPGNITSSGSSLDRACSWSGVPLAISITSAIYPLISKKYFSNIIRPVFNKVQTIENWNIIPLDSTIVPYWASAWGKGIGSVLLIIAVIIFILACCSFFIYRKTEGDSGASLS